ncbi:MAG: holo-ACP synthase [Candidatus Omnitrophica bacterium]|nr:holo-ACP synthase [Candidatus Omnitrophota bacterium]
MGIGIDIVSVSKIEKIIDRWGDLFLKRVYSANELKIARKIRQPYQFFAGRFAAKEALVKALGKDVRGMRLTQLEVLKRGDGSPFFSDTLNCIKGRQVSLSISHNDDFAVSVCLVQQDV